MPRDGCRPFLEQARESGVHRPARLFIGGDRVNGCRRDVLVAEGLLNDGHVDVGRNEDKAERVFEAMRMPPIRRRASTLCDGLEHTKELRAVNPPALLAREDEIANVVTRGQPCPQNSSLG